MKVCLSFEPIIVLFEIIIMKIKKCTYIRFIDILVNKTLITVIIRKIKIFFFFMKFLLGKEKHCTDAKRNLNLKLRSERQTYSEIEDLLRCTAT